MVRRRPLLIKGLSFGTIDESFQHNRSITNPQQRSRSNRKVVAHQIELGHSYLLREIELLRMRYPHLVAIDRKNLGCLVSAHTPSRYLIGYHQKITPLD